MEEIFNLNHMLGLLINSFAQIYIWSRLLNKKINFKGYKFYLLYFVFAVCMMLNKIFINDFINIIMLVFTMAIIAKKMFNCTIIESAIVGFCSQIIMMISELVFIMIVITLNIASPEQIVNSFALGLIVNIFVSVIAIGFTHFKFINSIYKYLVKITSNLKQQNVFIIMIIILISINFVFLAMYNNYNMEYILFTNIIISIIYILICFKFIKAENNYCKITNQYNTTLNSLKEYEEILDAYRVSNHENKNQILTIRNMIVKKEKGIPEYIDKLIDNKIKDDEKIMFDTNKIPAGGLRAVIYSKMLYMKENKINFQLNIDRGVRTVELIELGEDLMLDICKIIGVFLDNAIQAVEPLDQKEIAITLYIDDDNMFIEITNNFNGTIDLEKIDKAGYTTKKNGHGYGLSLVKKIIDQNNKLINKRKINKNVFVQNLQIKLK